MGKSKDLKSEQYINTIINMSFVKSKMYQFKNYAFAETNELVQSYIGIYITVVVFTRNATSKLLKMKTELLYCNSCTLFSYKQINIEISAYLVGTIDVFETIYKHCKF